MGKVLAGLGFAFLLFVALLVGTFAPDDAEITVLSWLANTAKESKQAAVARNSDLLAARIEIEELRTQLNLQDASCAYFRDALDGQSPIEAFLARFF
jgi:hypothetical protein